MKLAFFLVALLLPAPALADDASERIAEQLKAITDQISTPLFDQAPRWECRPEGRFVCDAGGCAREDAEVTLKFDSTESTYTRCDSDGCQSYRMTADAAGVFTTLTLPQHPGNFVRVSNKAADYVEVLSVKLSTHQSFGSCKPLP